MSGLQRGTCKTCGADILWGTTIGGKAVPLNAKQVTAFVHDDTAGPPGQNGNVRTTQVWVSHFSTCPQAEIHRKR